MIEGPKSIAVQSIGQTSDLTMRSSEIKSIGIENPSGAWLQLNPGGDLIPPNTIGYIHTFPNATARVTLSTVAAPVSGQTSAATGGPILVYLYDSDAGDSPGILYTTATKSDISGLQTSIDAVKTNTNGLQASIDAVKTNTQAGGTLETRLSAIQANSGYLNTPLWGSITVHAASVTTLPIFAVGGINNVLRITNPPASAERVWITDDSTSLAANIRSLGDYIAPGERLTIISDGTRFNCVSETVDVVLHYMTALRD